MCFVWFAMTKDPSLPPVDAPLASPFSIRTEWLEVDDGSRFSDQIAQSLSAARAAELLAHQTQLAPEPANIAQLALDNAWDCWCNLTEMEEWNQPRVLQVLRSGNTTSRSFALQCRLDRLADRRAFPRVELNWASGQTADVRFQLPRVQSLEQARSWKSEFERLERIPNWPEMLLALAHQELRKVRADILQIKRSHSQAQRELEECLATWAEATWSLLKRGSWSSLQGEELHIGATPEEAIASKAASGSHPFWEWTHRKQPQIILALRLIRPSASGKRWLVESRQVSNDLFSSPQGQTASTAWKRTVDLKKGLSNHFSALLLR